MSIVDNLNDEQKAPVLQTEGAVLVSAGAGSGKTRLLTHRIAFLISEKGVAPYNILAITFTNKAAREMKTRVCAMIDNGEQVWLSTFHALCVKILRKDIEKLGFTKNFSIYTDIEKNKLLKDIYADMHIVDDERKKAIEYHMSNIKNNNTTAQEYIQNMPKENGELKQDIVDVFNKYQQNLKTNNALDFDDLLVMTYNLLIQNSEICEYYQNKFHYIHVDEFQDTNTIQYDLICLLAKKWGNILVVGDEDQCIYGWRGAIIGNIVNFTKDFANAKIFKLQQNYRSTQKILAMANKVIENNSQRLKKTLWTQNGDGADVTYFVGDNDRQEADYVARTIKDLVLYKGYNYSDIAVLMRFNAPSRVLEEYMLQYNLPYKMLGGFKFYERVEIKNIVAYFRALVNPMDNESILRIINFPKRGIGDTAIQQLKNFANGNSLLQLILNCENYDFSSSVLAKLQSFRNLFLDLDKSMEQKNLPEFANYLIDTLHIKDLFDTKNEDEYNKLLNINSLLDAIAEFAVQNQNATLSEYLESITLISDIDSVGEDNENVLISTVHAVKGLEFKVVFVVAMEDGIFPIIRGGERPSDIEEERRLAYVAITRAKEKLYLSRSCRRFLYNDVKFQDASRFLREMGFEDRSPSLNKDKRVNNTSHIPTPSIQKMFDNRLNQNKKDYSQFVKGVQVFHTKFGLGTIVNDTDLHTNKSISIDFGGVGIKVLSLDYAPLQIFKK